MSGHIEDEAVRCGQALYEQKIRAAIDEPKNRGKMPNQMLQSTR